MYFALKKGVFQLYQTEGSMNSSKENDYVPQYNPTKQKLSLHPVASLNNVTINQRAAGCGLGRPREGAAAPFLRG